jgi:hypothetical protein
MSDGTPLAIEPNEPLGSCPLWPVLFSLSPAGEQSFAALQRVRVGSDGERFASTRAIVSALILYMPEEPDRIVALSQFSAAAGPMPPPGTPADKLRRRTQVRLPAPLSLRLNRLISLSSEHTGQRSSRSAIVVSLMKEARRRDTRALWRERFTNVLSEPAFRAVPLVDADRSAVVLRLARPSPGPRPHGLTAEQL